MKYFRREDLILIFTLFFLSFTPWIFSSRQDLSEKIVRISIDGMIDREISLQIDSNFILETADGFNEVEIKNRVVSIKSANCPDKICMRRKISEVGESIACIPHGILIEVVNR